LGIWLLAFKLKQNTLAYAVFLFHEKPLYIRVSGLVITYLTVAGQRRNPETSATGFLGCA